MPKPRLYRDPVHGQIRLSRVVDSAKIASSEDQLGYLVPALLDTQALQRLRHIRQNGLTNFVFSGMEHSRFVHSMGVFQIARNMYDDVCRNSDEAPDTRRRTAVAVAGLLHDIGHGPFSHAFEQVLTEIVASECHFSHEMMTARILREDERLIRQLQIVDATLPELVLAYIDKDSRKDSHWSYRIVSSQMDADRIDYMQRDARQAGIQGHGFDLPRLLDNLFTAKGHRLIVDIKAVQCIEAFLLMNLHLYQIAYFHHTVRAANALLVSVIKRALTLASHGDKMVFEGLPATVVSFLKEMLLLGSKMPLDLYLRTGEHQFWSAFEEWRFHKDRVLADLAGRLVSRQPFKTLELEPGSARATARIGSDGPRAVASCIEFLSETDARDYYVTIDEPSRTAYKLYQPTVEGAAEEAIWVRRLNGTETTIETMKENNVIQSMIVKEFFSRVIVPPEALDAVRALL